MIDKQVETDISVCIGSKSGPLARSPPSLESITTRSSACWPMRAWRQSGSPAAVHVDPFVGFITETLKKYPKLRASRLHQMARERGYAGGPITSDTLLHAIAPGRLPRRFCVSAPSLVSKPKRTGAPSENWHRQALRRLGFRDGAQLVTPDLPAFLPERSHASFVRGHVDAFAFFGSPRVILYDNLKSAVLERKAHAIHFNQGSSSLALTISSSHGQ